MRVECPAWGLRADLQHARRPGRAITPVHAAPVVTGRVTSVESDDADSPRVRLEWCMTLDDGRETLRGDAELSYKPDHG